MLSIILPVYNGEEYVVKCINSIINQTYKDIELIIIDDGSEDLTSYLCVQESKKDYRIRFYKRKNLGVSAARNFGLEIARGEYITFIDCDDWIDSTFYEQLMKRMEETKADIIISGIIEEYYNKKELSKEKCIDEIVMDRQTAIEKLFCQSGYQGYLWNKIYKKCIFLNIYLNEKIYLCEDLEVNVRLFANAKRITYCPNIKYHYYKGENSITTNCNRFFEKKLTIIDAYDAIIVNLKLKYPFLVKKIKYIKFRVILNLLISIWYSENKKYNKYSWCLKKKALSNINRDIVKFLRYDDLIRIFLFLILPYGYLFHKYFHWLVNNGCHLYKIIRGDYK